MRSLILAGGGIKVAYQAGVLQVWLDEAGLTFDHVDGASGGCLNLAMYCQGMSGGEIADNWRRIDPVLGIDLNWEHYWKLAYAPSLATLDNYRSKVFPAWGLDWDKIRSGRLGTFNVCNFSTYDNEVKTNDDMSEDFLIAGVSLPMWFPPVVIDGQTYLDPVFLTAANVEEAIRRGADEIWVIWTASTRPQWHDGFLAQYFQIVEIAANGRFFPLWRRLEKSNAEISAGSTGEFGRPIELRLLQAEVPIHYLLNVSGDRLRQVVELGVKEARQWCLDNGVALRETVAVEASDGGADATGGAAEGEGEAATGIEFTETMKGHVTAGESDYDKGARAAQHKALRFELTIGTDDLDRFIHQPEHQGYARGWVESELLGGRRPVVKGIFNLLVSQRSGGQAEPRGKEMLYRLFFENEGGHPMTLCGVKKVVDDEGIDVWRDTTTLFTRLYNGQVEEGEEDTAELFASGILVLGKFDFARELTSFQVQGPGLKARAETLARFGKFFFGSLWDVYAQRVLTYSPF